MKILLVEDIRVERLKLKRWLEELRCEVIDASNGVEGIAQYYAHGPELVITDIIMPEKEGIEIILALRKGYPDVPIIAMSGGGIKPPDGYLKMAKLSGAQATFEKPIKKEELLNAIKKALEFK